MQDPLRLDIQPPSHGWAIVTLVASGLQVDFAASYTPWDSIGSLIRAVSGILNGLPEVAVSWNSEPEEYEFLFTTRDGKTRLEIYQHPDHRRRGNRAERIVASLEGETQALCRAIWKGLRRLQGVQTVDDYDTEWRHPFPTDVMNRLTEQFEAVRS